MSFNLNEEVIDGHLVTAETKKLWAVEMDLAQKLLEVCKKHDLKIWADAGTLLGAVRHKGFIPWDDDMDFCMMREDYNRLLEIGPKEFKEPYFFQSIYTDNTWGGMAKIRRSDTAMIDSFYKELKDRNSGVFIDIFVLDGIPANEDEFLREYVWVQKKRRMLTRYWVYKADFSGLRPIVRTIGLGLYFAIMGYKREQRKLVKKLSSNKIESCKYCTLIDFYAASKIAFNNVNRRECSWYNETVELPYHDMMVPAPKEYHKMLTSIYGDYMTPVKGGAIHSIIYYDCNRSYKEVIAELKSKKNKNEDIVYY